jgi:hypothetical protein
MASELEIWVYKNYVLAKEGLSRCGGALDLGCSQGDAPGKMDAVA